jgi:hypothetical protein
MGTSTQVDQAGLTYVVKDIRVGATQAGTTGTALASTELLTLAGVTAGTVSASKALVFDSNKDITGARNETVTGTLKSSGATAGVGYATGAGGTVTQATNKTTGVTLNNVVGAITLNAASLAATTSVGFTVTNSAVAATDIVIVNIKSGGTVDSYTVTVDTVAAGSFRISLRNVTAGALAEAVVLNFAVIKGVTS